MNQNAGIMPSAAQNASLISGTGVWLMLRNKVRMPTASPARPHGARWKRD